MPVDLIASRLLSGISLLGFPSFSKGLLDPPIESPKKNPQDPSNPKVKLSKQWMKLYGLKELALGAGCVGSFTFYSTPIHIKFLLQIGVLLDGAELCYELMYLYYWRGVISRRVMIWWSGKALYSLTSGMFWSGILALASLFKKDQPKAYLMLDEIMFPSYIVFWMMFSFVGNIINGNKREGMK